MAIASLLFVLSAVAIIVDGHIEWKPVSNGTEQARSLIQVFNAKQTIGNFLLGVWNSWNSLLWCGKLSCPNQPTPENKFWTAFPVTQTTTSTLAPPTPTTITTTTSTEPTTTSTARTTTSTAPTTTSTEPTTTSAKPSTTSQP